MRALAGDERARGAVASSPNKSKGDIRSARESRATVSQRGLGLGVPSIVAMAD